METNLRGYSIDHSNGIIVMNYKFAAAANRYGTPEYKLLLQLREDFPLFRTETRSGRKRTTCNANKRLTYENMKRYILSQPNTEELYAAFEQNKEESKAQHSPYAYVRSWFVEQFPDYKSCSTFVETTENIFEQKAAS